MSARLLAAFACLAVAGLLAAGCGEEEHLEVAEGERLELGELIYNIQMTRFLNPDDLEDRAYLEGNRRPPRGKSYLAVFLKVENHGERPVPLPGGLTVHDTRGNEYHPLEAESVFALDLGDRVPADGELPRPDTAAASGPVKGAMLLFLVDDFVSQNRPMKLEIPAPDGEPGEVVLDI